MSNHVHFIVSAKNNNLSDVLRGFKKFTGKPILKAITENKHESRREWMLDIFKKAGIANSRNSEYQFWRQDNQPMELYSAAFVFQKINYIYQNPVEAGIVEQAEEYLYSSARDYFIQKSAVYWRWFFYNWFDGLSANASLQTKHNFFKNGGRLRRTGL